MDYQASKQVALEAMITPDAICWWCGLDGSFDRFVGDHICPVFENPPIIAAHDGCNQLRGHKIPEVERANRLLLDKSDKVEGGVVVADRSAAERREWLAWASEQLFGQPRSLYAAIAVSRRKSPLKVRSHRRDSGRGVKYVDDIRHNVALKERGWL